MGALYPSEGVPVAREPLYAEHFPPLAGDHPGNEMDGLGLELLMIDLSASGINLLLLFK